VSASAWSVAAPLEYLSAAPHLLARLALGGMHSLPEGGYSLLGSVDKLPCRLPKLLLTQRTQTARTG
jgi:hypothetical protein